MINNNKGVFMGWMRVSPPRAPPPPGRCQALRYTIPVQTTTHQKIMINRRYDLDTKGSMFRHCEQEVNALSTSHAGPCSVMRRQGKPGLTVWRAAHEVK